MNMPTAYLPSCDKPSDAHNKRIYTMRVSANYLVSGGADASVRVWSKTDGRLALPPLLGHPGAAIVAVTFSEELGIIFGGDSKGNMFIWRLSNGEQLYTQTIHQDIIKAFALDETTLVSVSRDQSVKIWEVGPVGSKPFSLQLRHTLQGHEMAVLAVQISHDRVYTSSGDKSVRIWNKHSGTLIKCLKGLASMAQFQIIQGATGPRLIGACTDGMVRLYDVEEGTELACLEGHSNVVYSVETISPAAGDSVCGPLKLASASYDGTVRVWAVQQKVPFSWECLNILSFSDAVKTPFSSVDQKTVDEDFVRVEIKANRAFSVQVDGSRLYCAGEGAEIIAGNLLSGDNSCN